ncbi:cytochrome b562 [Citrobacter braakii]|uniref:cytochrome b562 n=1 Tax=Citrobacter braakii TaxID=57706 RepID=UPI00351D96AB
MKMAANDAKNQTSDSINGNKTALENYRQDMDKLIMIIDKAIGEVKSGDISMLKGYIEEITNIREVYHKKYR